MSQPMWTTSSSSTVSPKRPPCPSRCPLDHLQLHPPPRHRGGEEQQPPPPHVRHLIKTKASRRHEPLAHRNRPPDHLYRGGAGAPASLARDQAQSSGGDCADHRRSHDR